MKILILSNLDMGLYKFRLELIQALAGQHEVVISVPGGRYCQSLEAAGARCVPYDFNRRGINPIEDLRQIFFYCSLIRKNRPDVVLTYTIKPNIYGGIACQIVGTRYLANITGLGTSIENRGLLSQISTLLYRLGLRKADCVFFQNSENMVFFQKKKMACGRTRLIPGSGVNLEAHRLEEYPDEKQYIRFLFVGRIMRDKGIEELLAAFQRIHHEFPRTFLDIVGGYDENYSELIRNGEKAGGVRYHGVQSDVNPFYRQCHCVILPSYHEGMSNVLLEAAATGRPLITTHVPGCCETFDEGVTGMGCEAGNTESLLKAMRAFVLLPWEARRDMGLAGRKKVEREFDRRIVVNAVLDEVHNVCSQTGC